MTASAVRLAVVIVLAWVALAQAEVQRVVVVSREPVLAGEYEKLSGTVQLELDPAHPANARIVDLARAPRNPRGRVEASADFMVLRPRRPPARGSTALLEVSNRGGKALLPYFTRAGWSLDPTRDEDFGDRLLTRLGLTLIWIGWQFDVPQQPGLLRLHAPVARAEGRPIEGLVRSDWTIERPTATLPLAHRDHVAYPVADPLHADNVLTVRSSRLGPREVVPRTTSIQTDPVLGVADGLLGLTSGPTEHRPKIFFTNTGYEYWGRAASLIHTSVDGRADARLFPNERIYHLAGAQHFITPFPPRSSERAGLAYRSNPLDFMPAIRALLVRLLEMPLSGRPRVTVV